MKLKPKGDAFFGERTDLDRQIMSTQKEFLEKGLTVWGTPDCDQCGACCYVIGTSVSEAYEKCSNLDETGCEHHNNDKPSDCVGWRCNDTGEYRNGEDFKRYRLLMVAVEILGTRTMEDVPLKD